MWSGYDLRPQYDRNECGTCEKCPVEDICPTGAFADRRLNLTYCFGCGMCASFCRHDAFRMNTGSVDLTIDDRDVTVPIICRQSDRLRANKLSLKLKKMIEEKAFRL